MDPLVEFMSLLLSYHNVPVITMDKEGNILEIERRWNNMTAENLYNQCAELFEMWKEEERKKSDRAGTIHG